MIEPIGLSKINMLSPSTSKSAPEVGGTDLGSQFSQLLNHAISDISDKEAAVNSLTEQFAKGELTDVHKLLIASQESAIGLQLTVQVRNKMIEAYQEIMRTQI